MSTKIFVDRVLCVATKDQARQTVPATTRNSGFKPATIFWIPKARYDNLFAA